MNLLKSKSACKDVLKSVINKKKGKICCLLLSENFMFVMNWNSQTPLK